MEINVGTFGTKGLPVFGSKAIDTNRSEAIGELELAFNNLMAIVKKHTVAGNELPLYNFSTILEQAWTPAYKAVAGKAIINA